MKNPVSLVGVRPSMRFALKKSIGGSCSNLVNRSNSAGHKLLEKKKAEQLMAEEIAELEAIGESDRIFTHINAMMVAQDVNQ